MGNDVRVYSTMYNTWLSSRLQNQPRSLARLIFPLPFVMSVTKDEVFDLINANNDQLIAFGIQTA